MKIHCPYCAADIDVNIGKLIGSIPSEKRKDQARLNGRRGGRPRGSKNKVKLN